MGEKGKVEGEGMGENTKHPKKAIVVRFSDRLRGVHNRIAHGIQIFARPIVKWYDSEPVRFFFFREKNPIHSVPETIPIGLLMLLTLVAPFLATIEFWLIGFGFYGVIAAMLFFVAIAWGILEVMHYRFDRPT
ncbi:MAG TPA: hypothetical protein VEC97_00120 [Candidatus Acidoferrales bacterium]|nr:hypothetical protein [Candidatus Acidoferrales bacterium]